jgi:hypothetical protein
MAMSADAGSPITPRSPVSLVLPRILSLRIRRVPFEAPRLRYFESSLSRYAQAIEFIVETDGVVPTRAYGPALFVGTVEVNNSELTAPTTWRFLSYEPERLRVGAPISWGWMKDPSRKRVRTGFRYEVEEDGTPST